MPTVHGMSLSGNCYKACLLLNQLGRLCAWIETDTTPGQTRTPEFLSLNSAGKVAPAGMRGRAGVVRVRGNPVLAGRKYALPAG